MRKHLLFLLLSVCLLPVSAQNGGKQTDSLFSRIDTLIKYKLPQGSHVGISVYDLTAGKPLYTYQADKLSRPASTMKLLTAITALSRPEADEPFRTEVWYKGTIQQDTLRGDLYVIGGFDPEFTNENLDSLASAVSRFPFSVITGKIYGDVSMKDSLYWGSGWLWDDNPESYQPYLSPLMLDKGVLTVIARPTQRGDTARLECIPVSSYYTIKNETATRIPSAGRFLVTRNWLENGNTITVKGNVDGRRAGAVNLFSSQNFFMQTFLDRLQAKGVRCASDYAFAEFQKDGTSVRIATFETPVQDVLNQLMKESDNLNAQAMLCRLGAQSTGKKYVSDEDGLAAIRSLIVDLGKNPDHYSLRDGCGLSHYDYLTPDLLIAFLKFAYSCTDVFQKLYKSLPIGGVDGTLKNRMKRGTLSYQNVHAKTGSYTGINSLAGYLRAANGHEIAFAVMNQDVLSGAQARAFQDAVCEELIKAE